MSEIVQVNLPLGKLGKMRAGTCLRPGNSGVGCPVPPRVLVRVLCIAGATLFISGGRAGMCWALDCPVSKEL